MKLTNSPLFAPVLGLAASLSLMAVPNNAIASVGALGTTGSLGFISSTVLSRKERRQANQAIARQQRQLTQAQTDLQTRYKASQTALQRKLDKAISERDKAAQQLQADRNAAAQQHQRLLTEAKAVMGEELTRKFEADYAAKYETATADFKRREDEFYHAEGELCDQIEDLQAVLAQNETYLREEFGKESSARAKQWSTRYENLRGQIVQYGEVIQSASGEALEEIKKKDLAIARLKGQVELLSAPRKFRGSSQDDATSNKVIEFFIEKNVPMTVNDFDRRMDKLTVKFFPEGSTTTAHVLPLMEELQLRLGLYALPTVAVENNLITITCQTDAKTPAKVTISEPPLSRLEKAISDAIHVRIAAPSGSGKSVLLGNLVNYLTQTYLSTYDLYDPKATDRNVWGNLTPTYYSRECIPAFFAMAERCLERIDIAADAARTNQPVPKFEPEFHIIDELEFMYGLVDILDSKYFTSKKFATNAKAGLKVGREHKIKLLFVTQSALCSDVNLKKNDFFNTTSLFLGQTIIEALDSDLMSAVSTEKKAIIRAEYKARLLRGDKYTILVYEPEKPTEAWLCSAPSPGHYAELAQKNSQSENPAFEGVAQSAANASKPTQTPAANTAQGSALTCAKESSAESAPPAQNLAALLAQGTHCPDCGTHSTSFKSKRPTKKGEVSVRCKSKECDTDTFKWKVV